MKKRIKTIVIIIGALLLITGCKVQQENREKAGDVQAQMKENKYPDEVLNDGRFAEVADTVDNRYAEPLKIRLSDSESGELLDLVRGTDLSADSSGSKAYYKLVIMNSDQEILDEWVVDFERNVTTKYGTLNGNETVSGWLRNMESSHNITYESVLDRKPGAHYFDDINTLDRGDLTEVTENNFVKGVEYKLNEKEIESIKRTLITAAAGDTRAECVEKLARIYLYDSAGAELYVVDLGKDGSLYCNNWPLQGDELVKCINEIRRNSGLQEQTE